MIDKKLRIGTEGSFIGSFEKGIQGIKRIEKGGYDSIWFADHLMGWIPDSIWTPDLIELSTIQHSPHLFYDVFAVMALAGWNTEKASLGSCVTEIFRRHPAVMAQTFLTLDNISKGRTILGIGAGEGENVIPYGIKWEKPVSRLEEALKIIKLLWKSEDKVSYQGDFWTLEDAVLPMQPFEEGKFPPIWIGAHMPKMLKLTGRIADGWIPTNFNPKEYKEKMGIIQDEARKTGRDVKDITNGLWCTLIIDEDHDVCDKLLESAYAKNYTLILPDEHFKRYGISHPLKEGMYGLLEYIPNRYDRKTMLEAFDRIPFELCEDYFLHGTPDEVIGKIEEYRNVGLEHLVLYNITYCCDLSKIKSSFAGLKKVLSYFKDEE